MPIDQVTNPQRSLAIPVFLLGVLTCMLTLALFASLDRVLLPSLPDASINSPLHIVDSTDVSMDGATLEKSTRGYPFPEGRHRFKIDHNLIDGMAVLSFDRTDLAVVSLIRFDQEGTEVRTTIKRSTPLTQRPFGTHNPVFDLTALNTSESPILFEVEADYDSSVNIEGWASIRDFAKVRISHNRITGFYFGATIALLFLSLLAYLSTHRRAYVYYAIFLAFHAITILGYEGVYAGTVLGKLSWIHPLFYLSIPFTVIFALKFLESFLQLKENHPCIQKFLGPFRCCFYPLIAVQLVLLPWPEYWPVLIMVQNLLVLAGAALYPVVSGIVAVKGKREHQLIYVAFIPHFLAVALYVTQVLGWTEPDPLFYYKLLISTFIEMLLIAVALGFLMQSLRRDKETADANSIANLKRAIVAEEAYRTKLETEVKERTAALAQSDKEKKRLLEIISHDLRAPLHSINAYSTMTVKDGEAGEEVDYRQTLIDVSQASQSLYQLLENLLSWTKGNWENIQPDKQPLDLKEVVRECLDLYGPRVTDKDIKTSTHIECPESVSADLHMLQTLLRNVFSNALSYTEAHGYLDVEVQTDADSRAVFRIKNGPQQIPQDLADEINSATSAEDPSFSKGLGLRLCKAMSDRNDWNFRIEPVNDGTCVSFEIDSGLANPT